MLGENFAPCKNALIAFRLFLYTNPFLSTVTRGFVCVCREKKKMAFVVRTHRIPRHRGSGQMRQHGVGNKGSLFKNKTRV